MLKDLNAMYNTYLARSRKDEDLHKDIREFERLKSGLSARPESRTEARIISLEDIKQGLLKQQNARISLLPPAPAPPVAEEKKEERAADTLIVETEAPLTIVKEYGFNKDFYDTIDAIFDPKNGRYDSKQRRALVERVGKDVYESFSNFASETDLYPTPHASVSRMVDDFIKHMTADEKEKGVAILEPSAGTGNIIRGLIDGQKKGLKIKSIDACEIAVGLHKLLDANLKIDSIQREDFMIYKPKHGFDVIFMNPPFSGDIPTSAGNWEKVALLYMYHLFRAMSLRPKTIYFIAPRYDPKPKMLDYIQKTYGNMPVYKHTELFKIDDFIDFKSGLPKPLKITATCFRFDRMD
jgi:hypothetical protein